MRLERDGLLRAMGLSPEEIPEILVLEGSWWQRERNRLRLSRLSDVRELAFPELHWGRHGGHPLVYSCVYGAPRAVEPVHLFASVGDPIVVLIGSCGALQPGVHTGDIVLPTVATVGEGASQYYRPDVDAAAPDACLVDAAERSLRERGLVVHRGPHLTTSALFAQPPEVVRGWSEAGYLGVDMETSAVYSAADSFGLRAVSLLFAWDELLAGRSFLDAFSYEERERQETANRAIFEVALELLEER